MRAILAVVVVIATEVTAAAQAPAKPPTQPPFEENDGSTAVALSIGGTVGGLLVIPFVPSLGLAGLVIGPSFGRWYNHELGAIGLGVRTGAVVYTLATFGGLEECESGCDDKERALYLGLAAIGVASLADYVQAGLGAERYNEAHRPRLQVAPTIVGRNTVGLGVGMQW